MIILSGNIFKTRNLFAIYIAMLCYSINVFADDIVEFNTDVLDVGDRDNIDLTRFSKDNFVFPGSYLLDVYINGQSLSQQKVAYIVDPDNNEKTLVCFTQQQIEMLALKEDALKKIQTISSDCSNITSIPGVKINNHEGKLDITMPQAWMKYTDPDWVPPERWDAGVSGLLFDYNLTGTISRSLRTHTNKHSLSAYGQTGFNLGAWRFRADYQANYNERGDRKFDWNQFYAYRPLIHMAAKLTFGEIYLNSQVFDTIRYTGINLASDERMLPPNLRGYAPQINGIAKSNSKIIVSRAGQVVYETTVPAGPFSIQDLQSSIRGTLDVRVEGDDGDVSTFQVDTANIPYLTRPGYVRYNISVGKPSRFNHKPEGSMFATSDFSWGLSNNWSLIGGALFAGRDYSAFSAGIGRDLAVLGALSADITQSISRIPGTNTETGSSFRLSYSKSFDELNSTITFAGYRFSQDKFRTLSQYLDERENKYIGIGRQKEMYTITGNKTFWADDPDWRTTLFLTYTHQTYWDQTSQNRYGLSVGRSFRLLGIEGVSTNIAAYRSEYRGRRDDSVSLSVSVPVGDSRWAGYDLQNSGSKTSHMLSYSDNRDFNDLWRIRAGRSGDDRVQFDGYYQKRTQLAEVNTNISYQERQTASINGTLRGGFTATRYGAALHNSSATTDTARIMVDTNGVGGVPFNHEKTRTNWKGISVVPDIVSYYSFDTRIDVDKLNSDVDTNRAIATSTLTEGAIGYQRFDVAKGEKLVATISYNGTVPPFGADVTNPDGVNVAMVMEQGFTYLMAVNPQEILTLSWGGKAQCKVHLPEKIESGMSVLLPCQQ
ncbi:fimbria/pilus outer membrane usher protein [Providencia heimbachae]|uniref:fimbria/pilus outer membrane usher protein n=2 Tax=Morganellaceae TaxID=1903414 RepID=UPI000837EC1C|nr:fimbria/pilus outer membrane usher protein [Providencia sp.]NIH24015.1 fimbria/pilus outer membrane usher protein [Providencia heimbachae]SQH14904.1 Outer membrane usher protein papC precursor [Providencia heimbachae]